MNTYQLEETIINMFLGDVNAIAYFELEREKSKNLILLNNIEEIFISMLKYGNIWKEYDR